MKNTGIRNFENLQNEIITVEFIQKNIQPSAVHLIAVPLLLFQKLCFNIKIKYSLEKCCALGKFSCRISLHKMALIYLTDRFTATSPALWNESDHWKWNIPVEGINLLDGSK